MLGFHFYVKEYKFSITLSTLFLVGNIKMLDHKMYSPRPCFSPLLFIPLLALLQVHGYYDKLH